MLYYGKAATSRRVPVFFDDRSWLAYQSETILPTGRVVLIYTSTTPTGTGADPDPDPKPMLERKAVVRSCRSVRRSRETFRVDCRSNVSSTRSLPCSACSSFYRCLLPSLWPYA